MKPGIRLIVVVIGLLVTVAPARAAGPGAVDDAIKKAKAYLYAARGKDGTWEKSPKRVDGGGDKPEWQWAQSIDGGQWGGQTALAVLALLAAGDNPQDERLAPAVQFLMKADLVGTYAIGVRCQVLLLLPESPQTKSLMARDVKRLTDLMRTQGAGKGFYGYVPKAAATSLSRSRYAILGMWAADQIGVGPPPDYWRTVEKAWADAQEADGGWRYQPGKAHPPVTAGITAVGVASMFIIQDQLHGNRGVDCRNPMETPAIQKGIDWMTKNFDRVAPDQKVDREYPLPNLYAVERVGVAGGLKYFGGRDWYKEGADYLVTKQRKDGSWLGGMSEFSNTCFGILFLSRGRAPVIFNKLDWAADEKSVAGNWNLRPRDVANLTRWIGRTSERDLNWQIVTLDAPIMDWHDAPITYLSGSDVPKVSAAHQKKLRQYVDEGGMLLAHADCGKPAFVGGVQALAKEMFPGFEFRELPADHAIYTSLYPRDKWKNKPSVLGLSNGVRELMILLPQSDPGKAWQIGVVRGKEDLWQLGANLVYYAAGQRDLRFKGDSHLVVEDPKVKTAAGVKVARLAYKTGTWDPEPGAWRRMKALLRNEDKLDVQITPVELGAGALDGFQLAHLTGTTKLKLDGPAKAQLKKFIAAGGTLVVDAAGGAEAFASSVEADLASLGAGAKLEPLPPDHSLFGGKEAMKVAYRTYAQKKLTGKMNVPRVKAVRVGDRAAVLFSREDITAGMVGQPVDGVVGYTPATATELMRRFVLRAAGKEPAAAADGKPDKKPAKDSAKPAKDDAKPPTPAKPNSGDGSGLD